MSENSTSLNSYDIQALLARVQSEQADPSDVEAFRAALRSDPALSDALSDLALQARTALAQHVHSSPAVQDLVRQGIERTIRSLDENDAVPLERLLMDNIGICWARLYLLEQQAAQAGFGAAYFEDWLIRAQGRFLRAVESLARVRRLLRPPAAPLQVNIAQPGSRQLNAQLPHQAEPAPKAVAPPKRFRKGRSGPAAR